MNFVMIIEDSKGSWEEDVDKATLDPQEWAEKAVEQFNKTLRPGERPRRLLRVKIIGPGRNNSLDHKWRKSNLVTIIDRSGAYDTMQCEQCPVTGRRHGFESYIRRDTKFAAKKFEKCLELPPVKYRIRKLTK